MVRCIIYVIYATHLYWVVVFAMLIYLDDHFFVHIFVELLNFGGKYSLTNSNKLSRETKIRLMGQLSFRSFLSET